MVDEWRGTWEFKNSRSARDGTRGTTTVSAETKSEAHEAIRVCVSRKLFGIITMQAFVEVTELVQVPRRIR